MVEAEENRIKERKQTLSQRAKELQPNIRKAEESKNTKKE
jgi:hypothetical protein